MTFRYHSAWQHRTKILSVLAAWLLVMVALVPSTAAASASEESAFISRVNQARAAQGLPALTPDVQLTNLARSWASSMRDGACGSGNHICHASPISAGVTHPWKKLGENVGTGPDVGSVMNAFIASPGHYANIMDPEFTHIGVGVVWEGNRMYTTHRFMTLQQATPTTTTTAAPTTTTAAPTTTAPPATTAAPTTTTAVAPTPAAPTTAAPQSAPTTAASAATSPANRLATPDDGGSLPTGSQQETPAIDPAQEPPSVAVLEERAVILIDALASVG